MLAPDLALEAELQIEGVRWTVADIRPTVDGADAAHLHLRRLNRISSSERVGKVHAGRGATPLRIERG